jgi:DNA-binding MarR family transcriptional regulator
VTDIAPGGAATTAVQSPHASYLVARLDRGLRREIGRLVEPHGLSVAQYTTLSILRSRGGLSNAQLARRLWVTPQSMNEVIAVLERHVLIERVPDPANRRILRTALTPRGAEVLAACDVEILQMEEQLLGDLTPEARTQFVQALEVCAHRIGTMSDPARR